MGLDVVAVAVVYVLAVARVTRLINFDVVFDPVRLWVARRLSAAGRAVRECEGSVGGPVVGVLERRRARWGAVSYFLGCPWCVSVWVAGLSAWVPLWHSGNVVAVYVGVVLAVSHVVGVGSGLADGGEDIEIVGAG